MSRRPLLLFFFLVIAAMSVMWAEVPVAFSVESSEEDSILRNATLQSTAVSLEHHDLVVVSVDEDITDYDTTAAKYDVPFVLLAAIERKNGAVVINFVWYDAAEKRISVRKTISASLDLTFDRIVDEAVDEIVDAAVARIADVGEANASSGQSDAVTGDQHTDQKNDQSGDAAQVTTVDVTGDTDAAVFGADAAVTSKKIDTAAGFAAFIAVGNASEYITLGYNPTFDFSFRINLKKGGFFGLGVRTGLNSFQASGASLSARSLVVPIGLDFRYVFESQIPLGLFARISAGPALFILQPPDDLLSVLTWDVLMKVIPYASVGLGLRVKITHFMGFALDMGYSLFLEDPTSLFFITGFTPAATIYFSI